MTSEQPYSIWQFHRCGNPVGFFGHGTELEAAEYLLRLNDGRTRDLWSRRQVTNRPRGCFDLAEALSR